MQPSKPHIYFDPNCECHGCVVTRQIRKLVSLEEFYGYRWAKKKFGLRGVQDLAKQKRKRHK